MVLQLPPTKTHYAVVFKLPSPACLPHWRHDPLELSAEREDMLLAVPKRGERAPVAVSLAPLPLPVRTTAHPLAGLLAWHKDTRVQSLNLAGGSVDLLAG